ncbi:MAG: oligosaccharide repeat unit polymerase [Legionella sp.]|nr:oligosaccharide repeat unit polymerase [Legionella sp.]
MRDPMTRPNTPMSYPAILLWGCFGLGLVALLLANAYETTLGVVLTAVFCFALATLLSSLKSACGIFSGSVIGILALGVYSLAVPIHHLFYQDYNDAGIRFVTSYCVIAALGQAMGYYALAKPSFPQSLQNSASAVVGHKENLRFGFYVLIFGMTALFVAISLTVGFAAYMNAGYAGRALLKREAGPIELGLYYVIIGYLFIANGWLYKPLKAYRGWLITFLGVFLVGFVIYVSILGIRRPSFFIVIAFLFLYFLKTQGKVPKRISGLSLVCVFLFGIFASFRQVLSDQGAAVALSYVLENFDFMWLDLSVTELGAPFRSMLSATDGWVTEGWLLGSSYFDAFLNLLPSAIIKFRESLSVQYTHAFFSDDYIAIGGNMGFFPVAEAYLNFGAIGVWLEFFVLGLILKTIENRAIQYPDQVQAIVYAITVPWFFFFLRTDFSSFLKSFSYSVIPVFVLYRIYREVLYRRKAFFEPRILNKRIEG